MPGTVRVKGLRELNRAFRLTDTAVRLGLRDLLKQAAEPVRARAEVLARQEIVNIGSNWSQMRIGVTTKAVYVAPKQRGNRLGPQKRPNLAPLLMDKAMQPALDTESEQIEAAVTVALDRLVERTFTK